MGIVHSAQIFLFFIFLTRHGQFPLGVDRNDHLNFKNEFLYKKTDIFVSTYPKCGTTWTIALVDNLRDTVPKYGVALGGSCHSCPWPEWHMKKDDRKASLDYFNTKMKSPRIFKSHSTVGILKRADHRLRVIQCTRNPLDCFVSAWHHSHGKPHFQYNGSFDHFFRNIVLKDKFDSGCWFAFHNEYFQAAEAGEIDFLLLKYEDMMADDGKSAMHELAKFIGVVDYDVEKIVEKSSFRSMKKKCTKEGVIHKNESTFDTFSSVSEGDVNQASTAHFRKGVVGDWVNYYSEEHLVLWKKFVCEKLEKFTLIEKYFDRDILLGNK